SVAEVETRLAARAVALDVEAEGLVQARLRLDARQAPIAALEVERDAQRQQTRQLEQSARTTLEQLAGERAEVVRDGLAREEIEAARGAAAQLLRQIADGVTAPEHVRDAKRLMGIAVGRFAGHYLTERHLSVIPL